MLRILIRSPSKLQPDNVVENDLNVFRRNEQGTMRDGCLRHKRREAERGESRRERLRAEQTLQAHTSTVTLILRTPPLEE